MALLYLASGAGEETGGGERVRAVRMLSGAGGRLRAPCVRHCVRVRRDSQVFMQHQEENDFFCFFLHFVTLHSGTRPLPFGMCSKTHALPQWRTLWLSTRQPLSIERP